MEMKKNRKFAKGRKLFVIMVIACLIVTFMVPLGVFGDDADYKVLFTVDGNQTSVGIFAIDNEENSDNEDSTDEEAISEDSTVTENSNSSNVKKGYLQAEAIPDLKEGWKWQDETNPDSLYTENDLLDMEIKKDMSFVAVDTNAKKMITTEVKDGKTSALDEIDKSKYAKCNVSWARTDESNVIKFAIGEKYKWNWSDAKSLSENMIDEESKVWDAANDEDVLVKGNDSHYYTGYLPNGTYTSWNAATWACAYGSDPNTRGDMRLFRGKFSLDEGMTSVDNFMLTTVTGEDKIQINDNMFVFVYPAENFAMNDNNFVNQLAFWATGDTAPKDGIGKSIAASFHGVESDVTNRNAAYRKEWGRQLTPGALTSGDEGLYLSDGIYLPTGQNNIATPIKIASEYQHIKNWIIDIYVQDVYDGGGMDQLYVNMSQGNDNPSLILKYWTVDSEGNWKEANPDGQSYYEVPGLTRDSIGKPYNVATGTEAGQLDMYKPAGYNSGVQHMTDYKIIEGNNVINILYTPEGQAQTYNTVEFKAGPNGTIQGDNTSGQFVTGTLWDKTCWSNFDNIPVPAGNDDDKDGTPDYRFIGWQGEDNKLVKSDNSRRYEWPDAIDKDYVFTAIFEPVVKEDGLPVTIDNNPDMPDYTGTDTDPETGLAASSANPPADTAPEEATTPVDRALQVLGDIGAPLSGGSGGDDVTIKDGEVARGSGAAWALLNLILTILTGLIAIALMVTYFTKRKDHENEDQERISDDNNEEESKPKKKLVLRILSVFMTALAIILFILTEDMTLPMIFTDNYTIYHIVMFVITVILATFSIKKYEDNEEEPEMA